MMESYTTKNRRLQARFYSAFIRYSSFGKERMIVVQLSPVQVGGITFTAVSVQLPKTNLLAVMNDKGYIMCGALDVGLLNEKLSDRKIIAGRAVGVRTIAELLEAPLESVTLAAEQLGIKKGIIGKDALLKMV